MFRKDVNALSIRAGSNNRNKGGIVIGVKAIIEHHQYDHTNLDYDIAVMELSNPLPLSPGSGIDYIDLPKFSDNITDGTIGTVTGWGTMAEGSNLIPAMLQGLNIPTLAQSSCKDSYGSMFTERMICAGYNSGGMSICYVGINVWSFTFRFYNFNLILFQGDGGSPFTANGVLIGISSWSYGCARPNYPGLYLNVPLVRDWIFNIIGL